MQNSVVEEQLIIIRILIIMENNDKGIIALKNVNAY